MQNPVRESFAVVCGMDDCDSSVMISERRWVPTKALKGKISAHIGQLKHLKMGWGTKDSIFFCLFLYSGGMGRVGGGRGRTFVRLVG